jgi:hypothetical protein
MRVGGVACRRTTSGWEVGEHVRRRVVEKYQVAEHPTQSVDGEADPDRALAHVTHALVASRLADRTIQEQKATADWIQVQWQSGKVSTRI